MLPFSPNVLSSRWLPRNITTKIHITTFLSVVLHGCETRSLTFMKEYRMRTMENRVLRKVCEPNRMCIKKVEKNT